MRAALVLVSALLMSAVDLGAPFVDASAQAEQVGGGLEVNLEVSLNTSVASVVAHIVVPGQQQQTVALNSRGNGVYGGVVTVPAEDVVIVFEAVDVNRDVLSQPATLSELGIDPFLFRGDRAFAPPTVDDSDGTPLSTSRWGWAALGLGAGSLALIAVWAAGGRKDAGEVVADR